MREFQLNLIPFFDEIDVLVFPATRDHFPRPVIEASAYGVPSIVTRLPSLTDVVEDGVTGLTCATSDPSALAEAMQRCIRDRTRLRRLGVSARRKYESTFSTTTSLAALHGLYNKV